MMGFSSLLINLGNLIHRLPVGTGNLTYINHCTGLREYGSFVTLQLGKILCRILLKTYHSALNFSIKDIRYNLNTLLLHEF